MDKQATLRQLREKLGESRKDSEAILDEAHGMDGGVEANLKGDLLARFTNSDNVVADTVEAIEALQRSIDMERADASVVAEEAEERGVGADEARSTYAEAFGAYLRGKTLTPEQNQELRAQTVTGGDAQGGYLVEDQLMRRIIEQLKAFGGVREAVTVIDTDKGSTLRWPTLDDTANEGEIVAETGPTTGGVDLTFGEALIEAFTYASKEILVSWTLMQDSEFDIEGLVRNALVTRLGRVTNRHFTTGTGTGQPDGLVTGSTAAASVPALTHDVLIDVAYSLDPAYMGSNVAWMLNHNTAGEVRKIVDGDGNKVWAPALTAGEPATILGYRMINNQHMPDVAIGNAPMLFGDFKEAYMVRDVRDLSIIRLDELYATSLQSGFFAWMRTDGTKVNTSAYRSVAITA